MTYVVLQDCPVPMAQHEHTPLVELLEAISEQQAWIISYRGWCKLNQDTGDLTADSDNNN